MRNLSLGRILSILSIFLVFLALPAWAADVELELEPGGGFSVKNSGGAIERFRVDEATGNLSRNGARFCRMNLVLFTEVFTLLDLYCGIIVTPNS